MSRVCPACQESDLPERSLFCLNCGAEMPAVEDAARRPVAPYTPRHLAREVLRRRTARDGERREVTILFVDIAGSLAMAEALDPEEIHVVMDGFFNLALDAVHEQRGTINQFRGDGFMALFGAPLARGEDAAGALRAALAIRERTQAYNRSLAGRFGLELGLRLGLHTGTVWVGSVGSDLRRDYTAEGPTVGLAARLEQAAEPGQILLSEETARRARSFFELRDLGWRHFRGLRNAVRVFELVGAGPHRDRFEAERARGLASFVGRTSELGLLHERLAGPSASGPRAVEICGEPGIGKSRLVHEYLAEQSDGRALVACAREEDAARAYSAWLELLRHWPEGVPGQADAADLARHYGGERPPAEGGRQFAPALAALLLEAGRGGDLFVVFEDLQWADPSSRDVLAHLLEDPGLAQLRLLLTSRERRGEQMVAAEQRIELPRLDDVAAQALAHGILAPLDDGLLLSELAVERGSGNPLFIEEVARKLLRGSRALRESARQEAEWRKRRERVPETLNGVLAARIDDLSDPAKRLLQAAAVIGRPFDTALLAEVEPECDDATDARIFELLESSLLEQRADGTLEFRHGLVRSVGYSQLLTDRRRVLHARTAEALIARGATGTHDGASLVGDHFDRAGLPERAAPQLATAGRAYQALSAMTEAAHHLARAWEIQRAHADASPADLVDTGLNLIAALNGLDRAGEASDVLDVLRGLHLETTQQHRLAALSIEGGWIRFSEHGDAKAGRQQIERGLALISGQAGRERLEMGARAHLVRLHSVEGETDLALEQARLLLALAVEAGDPLLETFSLASAGSALCDRGDLKRAVSSCLEAVAVAERAQSEVAAAMAYALLAQARVCSGEPDACLEAARHARVLARKTDQVGALYHAATWGGEAYLLRGEIEAAAREFDSLAEINRRWPSTPYRQARSRLALGRVEEAARLAAECLDAQPTRVIAARAACTLGLARGLLGEHDRGERLLLQSATICQHLGLRPHLAEARAALADLCRRAGDPERARLYASEAREIYRACGSELHASRVPL